MREEEINVAGLSAGGEFRRTFDERAGDGVVVLGQLYSFEFDKRPTVQIRELEQLLVRDRSVPQFDHRDERARNAQLLRRRVLTHPAVFARLSQPTCDGFSIG
mgnify:CR=1 FL=1